MCLHIPPQILSLPMARTQIVVATFVYSPFNRLTRLPAIQDLIESSRRRSFGLWVSSCWTFVSLSRALLGNFCSDSPPSAFCLTCSTEARPCTPVLNINIMSPLFKINFNIIIPYPSWSPKWSLAFGFPDYSEQYKAWRTSLCSFLYPPVTSSHFDPRHCHCQPPFINSVARSVAGSFSLHHS